MAKAKTTQEIIEKAMRDIGCGTSEYTVEEYGDAWDLIVPSEKLWYYVELTMRRYFDVKLTEDVFGYKFELKLKSDAEVS